MIKQCIFTTARGRRDTVQYQRIDLLVQGIIITISMPVDRLVGIGDLTTAPVAINNPERGDAIIRSHSVIRRVQIELLCE